MGQDRRLIKKKRFVTVTFHEVDRVIREDVRAKLTLSIDAFTVANDIGVPVTFFVCGQSGLSLWPNAVLLKSMFFKCVPLIRIKQIIDLPLAGNGGLVSGITQQTRETDLTIPVQKTTTVDCRIVMCVPTGTKGVTSSQQHGSRGTAYWCDIEVAKFHSGGTETVDVGGLVFLTAVAPQPVLADVIEQNENNVGLFFDSVELQR